jgi:Na+-driven multidrug efflux pump
LWLLLSFLTLYYTVYHSLLHYLPHPQVALQLWLLLSFLVDALAVAAQTLVADELGKGSVINLYST